MPSPVTALICTVLPTVGRSYSAGTRSHLFITVISGVCAQPRSASKCSVTSKCSAHEGSDASQTLSSKSAAFASSKVDLKASTKWCGKRRTSPTVSTSITLCPFGRVNLRAVGSKVANNLSSANTPASVKVFNSVDLPALV